jgi:arylsulfatase A-like enzyme
MPKPNILWYCTDQQRYDTIHALGNPEIRTPTLDRLVENGAAFTRAYTQSPICTPSRATFLTGRYPASHHVHRNGNDTFPSHETLVTKTLADAGYDCGLAGKLHLSRAYGRTEIRPDDGYRFFQWSHHPYPDWEEGHDYADWLKKEKGVDPKELFGGRSRFYGPGIDTEYHQTTWCSEMAIRFITEKRDGPWLMSINPFDPHPPFDPPQEFLSRYDPSQLSPPLFQEHDLERQKAFQGIDQQTLEAVDPRSPVVENQEEAGLSREQMARIPMKSYDGREVKACYYAMIELIDFQLGRIIDVLHKTGQLENTIIIFMSDHGELLGDHGLMYKGCRFFEPLVRVPLLISWPARCVAGLRSDALVELVDIPPTLLDCAGMPIPPSIQGSSLLPLLEGKSDPSRHKPHVVCEFNDALELPNASHATMTFDGRYKVCLYHDTDVAEIYDLEEDPGEFRNLWELWKRGEEERTRPGPARPGPARPKLSELIPTLLRKHCSAVMRTSDAGVPRTGSY